MKSSFIIYREGGLVDIDVFNGLHPRWEASIWFSKPAAGRRERMVFTKVAWEHFVGTSAGDGRDLKNERLIFHDPVEVYKDVESGLSVALTSCGWTEGRRLFTAGYDRFTSQEITISLYPKMAESLLQFVRTQLAG